MSNWRIYKPNKNNNGAALQLQHKITKDKFPDHMVMAQIVPQIGTDDNGNAKFIWDQKQEGYKGITVKLGTPDLGSILTVLNGIVNEAKLFHQNSKGNTTINFSRQEGKNYYGLSISAKADNNLNRQQIAFSLGEAEVLRLWIQKYFNCAEKW